MVTETKMLYVIELSGDELVRRSTIIVIIIAALSFFTLNFFTVILAVGGIFLSQTFKRWTPQWAREAKEWIDFKKFLTDFAGHKFKEIPPEAYKLWERYLIFGILFGVADKIVKMLPLILENPQAIHAAWYYSTISTGSFSNINTTTASISQLANTLNVMTTELKNASTSATYYSSGHGAGFSGGAGGGGGAG